MKKEIPLAHSSVISSYYTVLAAFAETHAQDKKIMDCLYEWGKQLGIAETKLYAFVRGVNPGDYQRPENQQIAVNQLYDLIYMIYLDDRVDDQEIEMLMMYAEKLGLPTHLVGDIAKAMLTAPGDGISPLQVKDELKDLLEASL